MENLAKSISRMTPSLKKRPSNILYSAIKNQDDYLFSKLIYHPLFDHYQYSDSGFTPLMECVRSNWLRGCRICSMHPQTNINWKSKNGGFSALHLAVKMRNLSIVRYLLSCSSIDINSSNSRGMTPFALATSLDNIDYQLLSTFLTDTRLLPNKPDDDGNTPLHHAVLNRQLHTILLLADQSLVKPVEFNLQNRKGETPLYLATLLNFEEIIAQLLLHPSIDISPLSRESLSTALGHAADSGKIECVLTFLRSPLVIEQICNANITPDQMAIGQADAIFKSLTKCCQLFLRLGHPENRESSVLQMAHLYVFQNYQKKNTSFSQKGIRLASPWIEKRNYGSLHIQPTTHKPPSISQLSHIAPVTPKSPIPIPIKNPPNEIQHKSNSSIPPHLHSRGTSSSMISQTSLSSSHITSQKADLTSDAETPCPILDLDQIMLNSSLTVLDTPVTCFERTDPLVEFQTAASSSHFSESKDFPSADSRFLMIPTVPAEVESILTAPRWKSLELPQKLLIWDYRYHLMWRPSALPIFLSSINWSDPKRSHEALFFAESWAPTWRQPSIAVEILCNPLLSSIPSCRQIAVNHLKSNIDPEFFFPTVRLLLPQLTHCLRYIPDPTLISKDPLMKFLFHAITKSNQLFLEFYWLLRVENDIITSKKKSPAEYLSSTLVILSEHSRYKPIIHPTIEFIDQLTEAHVKFSESKTPVTLESVLSAVSFSPLSESSHPTTIPTQPNLAALSFDYSNCKVFESKMKPWKLTTNVQPLTQKSLDGSHISVTPSSQPSDVEFNLSSSKTDLSTQKITKFSYVFKRGDDLRQDHLALQIIFVMKELLAPLKLCLTPFSVLPTGPETGFVEFVSNSATLTDILTSKRQQNLKGNPIHAYWKMNGGSDENAPMGVKKVIIDTFIRSVAGSCVFNWILGVGDRHNENVLITRDGRFVHIDFGFLFGRDPKFSVAFKLVKEMTDAMGTRFSEFTRACCRAFLILRKPHNMQLILALCRALLVAELPHLTLDRIEKMRNRFVPYMGEFEAKEHFKRLIDQTLKSKKAKVSEASHTMARALKKYRSGK